MTCRQRRFADKGTPFAKQSKKVGRSHFAPGDANVEDICRAFELSNCRRGGARQL
jgi:hypothetical protein